MDRRAQMEAAAERYRATARERDKIRRQQRATGTRVVDSPEQVEARASRLIRTGNLAPEALTAAVMPGEETVERHLLLERILAATNDLQAVNFLPRGARTARTIARLSLDRRSRLEPYGTGFLVAPSLLMTNNHVLPDLDTAEQVVAEFNYEIDPDDLTGTVMAYRLDPRALFLTDQQLDYTLVAVQPGLDGTSPAEQFGWNRLLAQQGKIVIGEPVNVVGHPMGRPKEIAIRNNSLQNQLDDFLHYVTDTEPGNSGSPVFNDQWEVVALHHSGVPRSDAEGNWLKSDGSRWQPGDGEGALEWVANEGARISVVLRHLTGRPLTDAQRTLLATMGSQALTPPSPAAPVPATGLRGQVPSERRPVAGAVSAAVGLRGQGPPLGGAELVFLHGRRQDGRDPQMLRAKWTAGLAKGLALAGLPSVGAADVWFPFYGDAFAESVGATEALPDIVDAAVEPAEALAPQDRSTRSLYESLIEEAADQAGMPPELKQEVADEESLLPDFVRRLQRQLSWVADRSGLDEVFIATLFRDVAAYLDRDEVRRVVLDTVLETVPTSGPVVLVSHSLGTVVAMDVLTRLPAEVEVVLLITAGSPLGMDGVFRRLLSGGPHRPERVADWLNAWCPADAVAIGCPLRDHWGDRLTEVVTDNPKERAHSIEEYLGDGRVAGAVGAALLAGRR